MRKELIIAIFLGGIIGVTVAFGIWRFTTLLNKPNADKTGVADSSQTTTNLNQENTEQTSSTEGLTIVRPRQGTVTNENTIQIAGITRPNSHVVIVAEDDLITKTNNGNFEVDIELVDGINQIPIYVITEGQQTLETTVTVTYSSQLADIENAQAVMGTITDITESSLQIRTANGEISQVELTDETSFVSTVQSSTDISFDDLAIGDFVVAIGQMGEMDVLNAHRIIVSSLLEESNDVIAYGTVLTLTSREFIVKNEHTGEEWSIDATDRPVVTALNDEGETKTARLTSVADEGDRIIIVGKMEDDELIARRIHVL